MLEHIIKLIYRSPYRKINDLSTGVYKNMDIFYNKAKICKK